MILGNVEIFEVVSPAIWRGTATRVDLKAVEIGTAEAEAAVAVETAIAVVNLGISLGSVQAVVVDRVN